MHSEARGDVTGCSDGVWPEDVSRCPTLAHQADIKVERRGLCFQLKVTVRKVFLYNFECRFLFLSPSGISGPLAKMCGKDGRKDSLCWFR